MNTTEKKFLSPVLHSYNGDVRKRWRVEYFEPTHNGTHGKRIVIYGNINAAKTAEERTQRAFEIINKLKFDSKKTTSILEIVIERHRLEWRKKTLAMYCGIANAFIKYLGKNKAETATETTINNFLVSLQKSGAGAAKIQKYRTILHLLYTKAIAQNLCALNPVRKVPAIKRNTTSLQYFSDAQIKLIQKECEGSQLWLACMFQFYTFIRPGELRDLKIGDLNFEMDFINVRGEISKNKKTQKVSIPHHFKSEIEFLKQYPNQFFVFGKEGKPSPTQVSINFFNTKHHALLDSLKIRGNYAFYSWKHTGVVKAVQAGLNIRDIQNQLRHHSLDMVQEYLKNLGVLQSEDLRMKFPKI